jgi:hypothetical protein
MYSLLSLQDHICVTYIATQAIACNATPCSETTPALYEPLSKKHYLTSGTLVPGLWAHQCHEEQYTAYTWDHPLQYASSVMQTIQNMCFLPNFFIYTKWRMLMRSPCCVSVYPPLKSRNNGARREPLLGNGSRNMFPLQRTHNATTLTVGSGAFYAVRFISNNM